jgi:hypothetical protein
MAMNPAATSSPSGPPQAQFALLTATRLVAGVRVPDSPVISGALTLAQERTEPYLFNHAVRSWLFAECLGQRRRVVYDAEVLAVAALLHDVGLDPAGAGELRFEVEAANAARAFARRQGMDDRRAQLVWDGVALNSTPSIGLHKEAEVALCTGGIGLDWGGWGMGDVDKSLVEQILGEFPRLRMKRRFTQAVCRLCETRAPTTYDNFARDFGDRFVKGYQRPSTVDLLQEAPFGE